MTPRCTYCRSSRRAGFSLVELLTVVGIIALLTAILLPSLRSARLRAKSTASAAVIKAMSDGLEMFHNDYDRYPDSSLRVDPIEDLPVNGTANVQPLNGAHWVYRALMGYDTLGVDMKARMLGDGGGGTVEQAEFDPRNPNALFSQRRGPYIDDLKFARDNDSSVLRQVGTPPNTGRAVALDTFNGPILYYRSNPRAPQIFADAGSAVAGVYNLSDNALVTGSKTIGEYGWNFSGNSKGNHPTAHPLGQFGDPTSLTSIQELPLDDQSVAISNGQTFCGYLYSRDTAATANILKPVKRESFILISAGADGLVGTTDDVKNFE